MTGFARNECGTCGSRFFTWRGLHEHECPTPPPVEEPAPVAREDRLGRQLSPEGLSVHQATGRWISSRNNARRVRCDVCALVSTPAGIGAHQKASGHVGRTALALEAAS